MSRSPSTSAPRPRAGRTFAAWLLLGVVGACGDQPLPEPSRQAALADTAAAPLVYTRELLFVGERAGAPLIVPFQFTAFETGGSIQRTARGWLAHGTEWDWFLDDQLSTPAAAGVWRIIPTGDLRVIAGDAREIDALVYRRGDRTLRLAPDGPVAAWTPRETLQYRVSRAWLELSGQRLEGSVLEAFRRQRGFGEDLDQGGAFDWMFVTDGADIRLLLAEAMGAPDDAARTFAWTVLPVGERASAQAEVRWMEVRTIEQARRDVPVHWSFRVPGTPLEGEVVSLGFDLELGPERAGRRAVKLRHTVEGWVALGEERHRIFGMVRHTQE